MEYLGMVNVFVVALIVIGFGSKSKTDSSTSTPPVFKSEPHHYQNTNNGGWDIAHNLSGLTGPCNIKKVNWTLSQEEFLLKYAYTEPVILVDTTDQSNFRFHSSKENLLSDYGSYQITVTTANTYSYPKVTMTLQQYVDEYMKPQRRGVPGKDTLYHFGDNDRDSWHELFSQYLLPPYSIPGLTPVLSFGLAGPGTGVPFHIHGPTFAETIYGRKRWFLYPPDDKPFFDPDTSTLDWVFGVYQNLTRSKQPFECVLHPGEVLYFPDRWWHATLNVDTTVFMSTFLA